jgi:4a-hydroxytetrahydrobiopterin dehydratase
MNKNANRTAQNALLNIFLFPGLGSLRAGRWLAGGGQIIFVVTGSTMLFIWFFKELSQYYGLMYGDVQPQAVGWIGETGGVLFAISWLWASVTSLSLFREASKTNVMPPQLFAAGQIKMDAAKIILALTTLPQWQRNGEVISRTFVFKDFPAAMKFINNVADLAEQAQHHPDADIRWNKVTLALTTHDAGGLTEKDFALAKQCDALSVQ